MRSKRAPFASTATHLHADLSRMVPLALARASGMIRSTTSLTHAFGVSKRHGEEHSGGGAGSDAGCWLEGAPWLGRGLARVAGFRRGEITEVRSMRSTGDLRQPELQRDFGGGVSAFGRFRRMPTLRTGWVGVREVAGARRFLISPRVHRRSGLVLGTPARSWRTVQGWISKIGSTLERFFPPANVESELSQSDAE
jgi:hypothetical protein